jgi:hypothetical protein
VQTWPTRCARCRTTRTRCAPHATSNEAAKISFDLARQQMQTGNANVLLLLTPQQTYLQSVIQVMQARAARLSDTVALFQALGGGWWNRIEPPAKKILDVGTGEATTVIEKSGDPEGAPTAQAARRWRGGLRLAMTGAGGGAGVVMMRIIASRLAASTPPWFSTSSSKRSPRNIVAQPAGTLFFAAKRSADRFSRKMPPARPSAARTTQNPCLFLPMKNSGIDVLSTRGSGRRGNLAVAPVTARAGPVALGLVSLPSATRETPCIGNRARSDSISGLVITVASSHNGCVMRKARRGDP